MSYDAFISYRSDDLAHAERVHAKLADAGFSVWFDRARLDPACDWHRKIEAGCEDSRVVLPILTPRWAASDGSIAGLGVPSPRRPDVRGHRLV